MKQLVAKNADLLWREHVPCPIGAKDKTPLGSDVDGVDVGVGLGRDNKYIFLRVVAPQIAEGPSHCQEGDLVDVSRPTHGSFVTHFRSIPNNSRDARLTYNLKKEVLFVKL